MSKIFSENEVKASTLEYFNGDELAASAICSKYLLKNTKGEFVEKTPDYMHRRLAKEFARIEKKFGTESAKLIRLVLMSSGEIFWVELSAKRELIEDIYADLDKIIIYPI